MAPPRAFRKMTPGSSVGAPSDDAIAAERSCGRPVSQVRLQRLTGGLAQKRHALLAALAQYTKLAARQVKVGEPCRGKLADAQPSGVRGLDQRDVAQRKCPPVAGGVGLVDESFDFADVQDLRETARQSRCQCRGPWISADDALSAGISVERAQRGHSAADGAARQRTLGKLGQIAANQGRGGTCQSA